MNIWIRFECGQEDRVSKTFGPFPFVQLTYGALRVGPDGEIFAVFVGDIWKSTVLSVGQQEARGWWSDVIIWSE